MDAGTIDAIIAGTGATDDTKLETRTNIEF